MSAENDQSDDVLSSENDVYIEAVVDRRVHEGKLEYLLQIRCFAEVVYLWEERKNLSCNEMIGAYETERQDRIRKEQNPITNDLKSSTTEDTLELRDEDDLHSSEQGGSTPEGPGDFPDMDE